MADVLHHLARRGVSMVNEQYAKVQPTENQDEFDFNKQMTAVGMCILMATFGIYYLVISAVSLFSYSESGTTR